MDVGEKGGGGGKRVGTRGYSGGGKGGKGGSAAATGTRAKAKPKAKGAVGGQRPAVQAPVSKPQGTKGGGPGSFCSKVRREEEREGPIDFGLTFLVGWCCPRDRF